MIIVEGPDGAGKTTLINHLVEVLDLPVAPRVVSKDAEAMTDLVRWTEDNVKRGFQATIFDRHRLISEPIYGPILRGDLTPEFADHQWFGDMMASLYHSEPILIYCLPPFDTVYNNVKGDPDNKVVSGGPQIRAIWGGYLNKAVTEVALRPETFLYDYTDFYDINWTLPRILHTIKERIARV